MSKFGLMADCARCLTIMTRRGGVFRAACLSIAQRSWPGEGAISKYSLEEHGPDRASNAPRDFARIKTIGKHKAPCSGTCGRIRPLHRRSTMEQAQQLVADMMLTDGFQAELIAAEPDVHQPIAFAIDERGRLWIAEAFSYPTKQPEGEGKDRILILEDRDGDGTFETKTTFIEGSILSAVSRSDLAEFGSGRRRSCCSFPIATATISPMGRRKFCSMGLGFKTRMKRSTASLGARTAGCTAIKACSTRH